MHPEDEDLHENNESILMNGRIVHTVGRDAYKDIEDTCCTL